MQFKFIIELFDHAITDTIDIPDCELSDISKEDK